MRLSKLLPLEQKLPGKDIDFLQRFWFALFQSGITDGSSLCKIDHQARIPRSAKLKKVTQHTIIWQSDPYFLQGATMKAMDKRRGQMNPDRQNPW